MARYIATIPNTEAGKRAVEHLKEFGQQFGIVYQQSLSDFLRQRSNPLVSAVGVLDDLPYGFHTVDLVKKMSLSRRFFGGIPIQQGGRTGMVT